MNQDVFFHVLRHVLIDYIYLFYQLSSNLINTNLTKMLLLQSTRLLAVFTVRITAI